MTFSSAPVKSLRAAIRWLLARTVIRPGSVRTIRWGPARGLRYRVFPGYGNSPIYGGWEPDVQRRLVQCVRTGAVVYDVGANYGIHTLLMARLVGSSGHVYAFEPVDSIRASLVENVALNGFANVTCVPLALDKSVGSQTFITGQHAGAGHLIGVGSGHSSGALLTVETSTLDHIVFDHGFRAPDLIKMDVEGAEANVIMGGSKLLKTSRPTIIVELHTPEQDVAVGRLLQEYGYGAVRIDTGETVRDLTKGWPHKDGLWGHVLARPL